MLRHDPERQRSCWFEPGGGAGGCGSGGGVWVAEFGLTLSYDGLVTKCVTSV